MSTPLRENDDAKQQRAISRNVLVIRADPAYSVSRLRALTDASRLRPAQGLAWVEAGPDGLPPAGAGDSVNGRLPRSGLVQDSWETVLDLTYATAHGGLWRGDAYALGSTATWRPLTDGLPSLAVNTVTGIQARAGSPEIVVLGTGDPYSTMDDATGWWGLWRSTDGGRSFHPLDGGPGASRFFGDDVNEIALVDRDRWFVATRTGLYWTRDGGRHFGANADADDNAALDTGNVLDVRLQRDHLPAGFEVAVTYVISGVGLRRFYLPPAGPPERGPQDQRLEYRAAPSGSILARVQPGHIAFDLAIVNGVELVAVSVAARDQSNGRHNALKWGTRGAAGAWAWVDLDPTGLTEPGHRAQTDYDHVLLIDPGWHTATAQGLLYAGSVGLLAGRVQPDGHYVGSTTLSRADGDFLHSDQHHLAVEPDADFSLDGATAKGVYVGNDGGAFYNADRGVGAWQAIGHAPTLLCYHVALVQNGEHLVLAAGFQDNGSGGASFFVSDAAHPLDPFLGARGWDWRATGGGDGGQVLLCEDPAVAGRTWMFCVENDQLVRYRRGLAETEWTRDPSNELVLPAEGVNFSATLTRAQDAAGAWNTVYLGLAKNAEGNASLYRCLGSLGSLSSSSFERVPGVDENSRITALLAVPVAGATGAWTGLWRGHRDGKVRYSADATAHRPRWEERTPPDNARVVTCLAADPRDPRVIVLTTGGFSDLPARYKTGRVWMYAPGAGGSFAWSDISGRDDADENLPDIPAHSVVVLGTEPRRILVGTEIGTFLTDDDGQTWQRLDLAMESTPTGRRFRRMPTVPAYSLAVAEGLHTDARPIPKVAVGTYGRSAWVLLDLARYGVAAAPVAIPALHAELDGAFGFVGSGTDPARELVLANRGVAPVFVDTVTVDGAAWTIEGAPLAPMTLAPGQVERRQVRLHATAVGLIGGFVRVSSPDPDQAVIELPLSAEVVPAGPGRLAVLGDGVIDFGLIDETVPDRTAKLVVRNVGVGPLTLRSVRIDGSAWDPAHPEVGGFEVLDAPSSPLPPDTSAELRVVFHTRPDQWDRSEGTLVIEPDSGTTRRVPLRGGTGTPGWVKGIIIGSIVVVGGAIVAGTIYSVVKANERSGS